MQRSPLTSVTAAIAITLAACSSTPDAGSTTAAESSLATGLPAPAASSTGATVPSTSSTEPVEVELQLELDIPVISIEGTVRENPSPYFGSPPPPGGVYQTESGFVVAKTNAMFCDAVATINSRPQPIDDYEELVVGKQYFLAVAPMFPSELADDLAVVLEWVDSVVADGQFTESEESLDGLGVAFGEINEFVDTHCLGRLL